MTGLHDERRMEHWAARVQRWSGVVLALFLPVHFYVLGKALTDPPALDGFLRFAAHPWVKLAEAGLVVLLAAHLAGGIRLLIIEFHAWRDWQKNLIVVACAIAIVAGGLYVLRAFE